MDNSNILDFCQKKLPVQTNNNSELSVLPKPVADLCILCNVKLLLRTILGDIVILCREQVGNPQSCHNSHKVQNSKWFGFQGAGQPDIMQGIFTIFLISTYLMLENQFQPNFHIAIVATLLAHLLLQELC